MDIVDSGFDNTEDEDKWLRTPTPDIGFDEPGPLRGVIGTTERELEKLKLDLEQRFRLLLVKVQESPHGQRYKSEHKRLQIAYNQNNSF